ncbi:MAG: penicillin-binding transpeptidase domain-containing protein [Armatimonadota bacterium]
MATWLSGTSKQHRTLRQNAFIWCGVYLVVFGLVIFRLFWLQVIDGKTYRKIADRYHIRNTVLPATRGRLLDRQLTVLASDDQARALFADPTLVTSPRFVAEQLAPVVGRTADELYKELIHQAPEVTVASHIAQDTSEAVKALKLPGLYIDSEDTRYRAQIDPARLPHDPAAIKRLAEALRVPETELVIPPAASAEASPPAPSPPETRRLKELFSVRIKERAERLRMTGITFSKAPPSFTVIADPRIYNADRPQMTAADAAALLAPVLGLPVKTVEGRLLFRPRFVPLKRDVSPEMYQAVLRLQGTMYVVGPGALLETTGKDTGRSRMEEAVDRLHGMLNDKDAPTVIAKEEIRRRLLPDAPPGALATKLVNGAPSRSISRRLFAKPIPGVMYGLPGIGFQSERKRRYPFNTLASPTLGFINAEKRGVFGLEETLDKTLRGADGREVKEVDARRMVIPERITQRIPPKDGRDVVLTLDANIQQLAQTELANAVNAANALRGQCIVLNPQNGEILALASVPCWDANEPAKAKIPLFNAAVSNYFEPGSTFKLVAVVAALEEGIIRDGAQVTYCSGAMPVGNRVIHEAHNAHGEVDCKRLIEQSCNIGAATLALKLGPERFLKWVRAFGFGQKTGVELHGELPGLISQEVKRANITLANMGFGQSIAVTIPQMAAAYAVAVNGGEWIQPHLVKAYVQDDGTREEVPVPRHKVCSENTAKLLEEYLENVCTHGTGKTAARLVPGYRMGGKTGTAQKPDKGGFKSGKYIASFVGIVPMNDPQFLIFVIIDEPKRGYYGGAVAGPVVGAIAQKVLLYANTPPTRSLTTTVGPQGNPQVQSPAGN